MISKASAPGKVILFGEHFVVYGVRAILCAIDKRITATSQFLDERKIRIKTDIGNAEIDLDLPAKDKIDCPVFMRPFLHIVKSRLDEFNEERGVEMKLESEIPPGVGLGSSSAACVAASASVSGLFDRVSREEILDKAIGAERTIFEDASGADSAVSTYGGLVTFSKKGLEKIDYRNDLSLIIANSRQVHSTREEVSKVREFKSKNEALFAELCQKESRLVEEALYSLKKNDLKNIGRLMSSNQELLRQIKVSTDRLDLLVNEASKTSYGAKITGAGGGGCMISLVDETNAKTTLDNLKKISDCFVAKIDLKGLNFL